MPARISHQLSLIEIARLVVFLERENQPALLTGSCDGGGEGYREYGIF